ncbi:flagellar export protein FliJ [Marinilactibacillus psychrotolerans]|uniref:Flagellar FliJ protein n=2 Tax=Marinilactibacillus psychrotolerans TaxID=191770 RepID=A0A5R9C7X4_9LACT|nr:flagellar export protein FliJ [Marinilactibacillus psychrotolerans]TLQ09356.1 flagellar export protein FliJ [Marinilactibacillus psychrotolerans]
MQPYHFSMEKILDWREDLEEVAKKEVKDCENLLIMEKQKLESLLKESRKLKSDNLFKSNIDSVKRHSLYKDMLDENIIQQKLVIKNVEMQLNIAQEKLLKANKNKRIMEKLEEKERYGHKEAEKKEEQKQLDEISTLQFGRNFTFNQKVK